MNPGHRMSIVGTRGRLRRNPGKRSGFGRESGIEAIGEFLQTKCIWFNTGESVPSTFDLR